MGWLKVRKCTRQGNAEPCPRCGKTMRGGVCPGVFC